MADFGIQVKNPSTGTALIDGQYANLSLRQKGTTTTSTATGSAYYFTVAVSGGNPIIAVSCPEYCFIGSSLSSGGVTTFTVMTGVNGASVDWYIFDDPVNCTPSASNWALIVRNKNTGKVVFDSRMKYMRVVGFEFGSASTSDPNAFFFSKTYSSVSKIAVVQSQKIYTSRFVVVSPPPNQQVMVLLFNGGVRAQGASLQGAFVLTQQFQDSTVPPAVDQKFYAFLALDVSNY